MLFFSNPFLISGFGTTGVGEDKKAEVGKRAREIEREGGEGRETKEGSRPDKTIGGSQGDDMVSLCT